MSLERAVEAAIRAQGDTGFSVSSVQPLIGGACQDLFRIELRVQTEAGQEQQTMVLRSDATSSLPGSLARRSEYRVIRAASAAGVRTPAVRWLTEDLVRDGASAYFMDWCDGVTIARKLLRDPSLADARDGLPRELASELVKIHSLKPAPDDLGLPVPRDPAAAAIATHREALAKLGEPRPVIELALCWLETHRPSPAEPCLCHGDFRTGNFALTPTGLSGVLDWEFAHWGDPADDLAWLCLRDWRFGRLDKPVGGFGERAIFYAAYADAGGPEIAPARLHYWEILNNLRWAIGAIYQGERYLDGSEMDLELVAIGRRVVQLEYEILRLLAAEPPS